MKHEMKLEPWTLNLKPYTSKLYSRSPKVGNPIASIPNGNVQGIPALFGLNPVSNFIGSTIKEAPL